MTGTDDDALDEATLAEIAQFARRAEAERLRSLARDQPEPDGDVRWGPTYASTEGDPLDRIADTFGSDGTPLIRTDFSDDRAWRSLVAEVARPRDFGGPHGPHEPHVVVYDEPFFEGATGESLADLCAAHEEVRGYVVLADARSMAEAESGNDASVVCVDLSVLDDEDPELVADSFLGRTFRCVVAAVATVEANLAIANVDFGDFADEAGPDGVFRGIPSDE